MGRLIDKGKVVDKISDLFLDKYEEKASSDLTEFYKEVLKILINEKGQSDWISVKDRLPEPSEKGLAYGVKTVTHWMPLPKPPKEQEET